MFLRDHGLDYISISIENTGVLLRHTLAVLLLSHTAKNETRCILQDSPELTNPLSIMPHSYSFILLTNEFVKAVHILCIHRQGYMNERLYWLSQSSTGFYEKLASQLL